LESVDPNSSASECAATGGYFAQNPNLNGIVPNFNVDSNGNVSNRWGLSPSQCSQMNKGLTGLGAGTTVLAGLSPLKWLGSVWAGLSQIGAGYYLNQQLCGE